MPQDTENRLRQLLSRPAHDAAPLLLGCILTSVTGDSVASGIISEVEAYDQSDPASHTFKGLTTRNRSMFDEPGTVYVYFTYGMHYCMNISVHKKGEGAGILLRALRPLTGMDSMWQRRYGEPLPLSPSIKKVSQLVNGPAKLTQALAVGKEHDGLSIFDPASPLRIDIPEKKPTYTIRQTPRIGLSQAKDTLWRWYIES